MVLLVLYGPILEVLLEIGGRTNHQQVFVSERKSDSKLCAVKVVKNNFNHVPFEAQALFKLKHVSALAALTC